MLFTHVWFDVFHAFGCSSTVCAVSPAIKYLLRLGDVSCGLTDVLSSRVFGPPRNNPCFLSRRSKRCIRNDAPSWVKRYKIALATYSDSHGLQRERICLNGSQTENSQVKRHHFCLLSPMLCHCTATGGDGIWQTGSSNMSLCPPTCILMRDYVAFQALYKVSVMDSRLCHVFVPEIVYTSALEEKKNNKTLCMCVFVCVSVCVCVCTWVSVLSERFWCPQWLGCQCEWELCMHLSQPFEYARQL